MRTVTTTSNNATWRTVLATAVTGTPAHAHLQSVTDALDAALAGNLTETAAAALFSDANMARARLIVALEPEVRARTGDNLAAARAVLSAARALFEELVAAAVGLDVRPAVIQAVLTSMEAGYEQGRSTPDAEERDYTCPRCGSGHVHVDDIVAMNYRSVEVRCEQCAHTGAWFVGGPEESAWS